MTRSAKVLVAACLTLITGLGATAALAVVAVRRSGSVAIEVHQERGTQVNLRLPAALAGVATAFMPREACRQIPAEAWRYIEAAPAVFEDLQRLPDATLVEVEGRGESVRIATVRGRLQVFVRSEDGTVNVGIPLGAVSSTLRHLASACAGARKQA